MTHTQVELSKTLCADNETGVPKITDTLKTIPQCTALSAIQWIKKPDACSLQDIEIYQHALNEFKEEPYMSSNILYALVYPPTEDLTGEIAKIKSKNSEVENDINDIRLKVESFYTKLKNISNCSEQSINKQRVKREEAFDKYSTLMVSLEESIDQLKDKIYTHCGENKQYSVDSLTKTRLMLNRQNKLRKERLLKSMMDNIIIHDAYLDKYNSKVIFEKMTMIDMSELVDRHIISQKEKEDAAAIFMECLIK